jgi:hypothetical protein
MLTYWVKLGVDIPVTTIEEYIKKTDWTVCL